MGRGRSKKVKGRGTAGVIDDAGTVSTSSTGAAGNDNSNAAGSGLLSPELMAELGVENQSEVPIDSSAAAISQSESANARRKKRQRERAVDGETRELAAKLSKSKAKKLKQLEEKKLKDRRRGELYRKLGSNKLAPGQLSLLQSSKTISQNQDTLKSRLTQAAQRAAAGMVLPDSAVRELESHPEMVAAIEEILALPVGGALAAVRKTTTQEQAGATKTNSTSRNNKSVLRVGGGVHVGGGLGEGGINGKVRGDDARRRQRAENHDGKKGGSGNGGMTATTATGEAAPIKAKQAECGQPSEVASVATAAVAASPAVGSGNRRGGKMARPERAVEVVIVRPKGEGSGSSSGSDSESESNSDSGDTRNSSAADEAATAPKTSDPSVTATQTERPDGGDSGGAAEGGPSKDIEIPAISAAAGSTATTTGASWAAKIMSSLARVPTAAANKNNKKTASNTAALSSQSNSSNVTDTTDGGSDDARNFATEEIESSLTAGASTTAAGDENDDGDDDNVGVATSSHRTVPNWIDGKAPVYHAIETPLPSVSDTNTMATAGDDTSACSKSSRRMLLPRPERWTPVARSVELQAARMRLPVCGMEQEITEAIHDNDAVILCGETGSGKSTQVPQFLYEAGYATHGLIGVTQPRRVAAVSTAERVAVELGTPCGRDGAVAYQIRYDGSGVGPKTRVKFMTDGVLMQEITSDLLLKKYSVVLLDEAHERNLNTDVLLGMLSRALPLRKQLADEEQRAWDMLGKESKKGAKPPLRPLKLVIMSATLRVTDFTENSALFPSPPPVISATSRQHPVTVHFSKHTELYDYVGETFKKVCKVHRRLPEGGVLVFLTGKREILHMCDKLRREFPPPKRTKKKSKSCRSTYDRAESGTGEGNSSKQEHNNKEKTSPPATDGKEKGSEKEGAKTKGKRKSKRARESSAEEQEADTIAGIHSAPASKAVAASAESPGQRADVAGAQEAVDKGGAGGAGGVLKEKPREMDREKLLFREADDDEEDAALLADMEEQEEEGTDDDNDKNEDIADKNNRGDGVPRRQMKNGAGDAGTTGGLSRSCDNDDDGDGNNGAALEDEQGDDQQHQLPPVHVVPLYAMLTAEEQAKVFAAPPEGHRLVVVATNVAETSITIPGISYVVDCGRQKRRVVQRGSGISQFEVGWVSRASADQRAGRAGRTGPGHCYRLYSSALYSQTLEAFAPPEVRTRPLEDVMLQMKAMGVVDVSRFPFPTPPDAAGLRAAAILLSNLGATGGGGGGSEASAGEITAVGKALALLPVGARYAKMLLLAVQGGVLAHAVAMVAMLTEGDPFVRLERLRLEGDGYKESGVGGGYDADGGAAAEGEENGMDDADEARRRKAQWLHPTSDALARLTAAGAYAHATSAGASTGGADFCRQNLLHGPTMERSLRLRHQLARLVNLRFGSEPGWKDCDVSANLKPPNRRQSDALRQVLLSGLLDNVARRAPAGMVTAGTKLQRSCAYLSCNAAIAEPVYIKSTSVLFSRDPTELPEYVIYQDIVRGEREGAPANMTCVSAIEPSWLPALAEGCPLLSFSEPLASPTPVYDHASHAVMCRVTPRYGVHAWELPLHRMDLANAAAGGGGVSSPSALASIGSSRNSDLVFRWFGRLLLEGAVGDRGGGGVLSELKGQGLLNDPPSLLTRDGKPTKKATILALELRKKGVCSLPALIEQWRRNRSYLKQAVQLWVKFGASESLARAWDRASSGASCSIAACPSENRRNGKSSKRRKGHE